MVTYNIPTQHEWLSLEPLSETDWLVTDEGQLLLTGDGVIGHIQYFLGVYRVLKRSEPHGRSFFDTRESAVESFVLGMSDGNPDRDADSVIITTAAA